jgi:hypothetical protein
MAGICILSACAKSQCVCVRSQRVLVICRLSQAEMRMRVLCLDKDTRVQCERCEGGKLVGYAY